MLKAYCWVIRTQPLSLLILFLLYWCIPYNPENMLKTSPRAQYAEADLDKKSCPGLKTTTVWKSILHKFKIPLNWNPRKSVMYCEFSKNDVLLMQQLKVLMASSSKTALWNILFSRISIQGDFEPIWDTLSCCGGLLAWAWLFI